MSRQQDAWVRKLIQAQLDLGSYLGESLDDDGFGFCKTPYSVSSGMNMEDVYVAYKLAVKRTMEIRVGKGFVTAELRIVDAFEGRNMGSFVSSLKKGRWTKWEQIA